MSASDVPDTPKMEPSAEERAEDAIGKSKNDYDGDVRLAMGVTEAITRAFLDGQRSMEAKIEAARREGMEAACTELGKLKPLRKLWMVGQLQDVIRDNLLQGRRSK